jgi:hypothetical protein
MDIFSVVAANTYSSTSEAHLALRRVQGLEMVLPSDPTVRGSHSALSDGLKIKD